MTDLVEKMRKALSALGGQATRHETSEGSCWRFAFDAEPGSDYRFVATLYLDNGEVQVAARRPGAPEDEHFWYVAYEPADYESLQQAHEIALADIRGVLTNESRIRHRVRILFPEFQCEYSDGGAWCRLSGACSYFRFGGFKPPSPEQGTEWRSRPRKRDSLKLPGRKRK